MKPSWSCNISISASIMGFSLLFWAILLFNPGNRWTMEHQHIATCKPTVTSFQILPELPDFPSQLIGWGLMVMAMMSPKLILPIQFIYSRSFSNYRFWCSLGFMLGYVVIWLVAGIFLLIIINGLNALMPISSNLPVLTVLIVAIIWQFSPLKQYFLNQGHNHKTPSAFGLTAGKDALVFGIQHGIWCIGSGWALMLVPMFLHKGHHLTMMAIAFIMMSEHLEYPKPPQWRLDFRMKLLKLIIVQTSIRLKRLAI